MHSVPSVLRIGTESQTTHGRCVQKQEAGKPPGKKLHDSCQLASRSGNTFIYSESLVLLPASDFCFLSSFEVPSFMSRKVCILQVSELRSLLRTKTKPNCRCHYHLTQTEADDLFQSGELHYVGRGRMYAHLVVGRQRNWRTMTDIIFGEAIGYTTLQLVR